jgi:hypothetical protein
VKFLTHDNIPIEILIHKAKDKSLKIILNEKMEQNKTIKVKVVNSN